MPDKGYKMDINSRCHKMHRHGLKSPYGENIVDIL